MTNWIDKLFNGYESIGLNIFYLFLYLFIFLFISGWIWLILNTIIGSIVDFIKNIIDRRYGYDYERNRKFENIEDKIEKIYQLPLNLPSLIYDKLTDNIPNSKLKKIKHIKGFVIWNIITIIIISFWYTSYDPINDFRLINNSIIVDGYITSSKQSSEIVEINDGRSIREEFTFTYNYEFVSEDGISYTSTEEVKGKEPEEFYDLENNPLKVKVNYLKSNPKKSRVFKYTTNNSSIYDFYRYTVLIGIIIITVWGFITFKYFIYKQSNKF